MNICFINPNRHTQWGKPPLGLLQVATACQKAGHNVRLLDATLLDDSPGEILEYCSAIGAEAIGITAMSTDYHQALNIARKFKTEHPEIKVILGGVHSSIFPFECLDTRLFDVVVQGEGEKVILKILEELKEGNTRRIYSASEPVNLFELPIPNYSLLRVTEYKPRYPHGRHGRWISAITSRGCPYNCTFCSKAVHGREFRGMRSDDVIALIKNLIRGWGIQDITFYDDVFTLDKRRVENICNLIISHGININWECESHINSADLTMMQLMKIAGCHTLYYGIETGSQKILDNLHKGIDRERIERAVRLTKAAGIKVVGYFMFGNPGESRSTIEETMQFVADLKLDHAQFTICSPLPGSELFNQYKPEEFDNPVDWSRYQYLGDTTDPAMIVTNGLSREYILEAVRLGNEVFAKKAN